MSRSTRYAWPTSGGHLYREQQRLVDLGWATVDREPVGKRTRNRYAITDDGRDALRDWLATPPQEPQFHVEGVLRAFYADRGETDDLVASLTATAEMARTMHGELVGFAAEYLADGGPMDMLERGIGGPDDRREFHGRPMYPERLHVVALAIQCLTNLYATVDEFCASTAEEVAEWHATDDPGLVPTTRARLQHIVDRWEASD